MGFKMGALEEEKKIEPYVVVLSLVMGLKWHLHLDLNQHVDSCLHALPSSHMLIISANIITS